MNSGFSGASCASSSARRTQRSSDASSNWLIVAVPTRLPYATLTAEVAVAHDAARRHAVQRVADVAHHLAVELRRALVGLRHFDDLAQDRLRFRFCVYAHDVQPSVRAVLMTLMPLKRAVLDAVRHRRHLARLALAVEEGAAEAVVALVADADAGVPELRRAHLVGDVLELLGDLAVLDLVEELAAELRVVALLVDRERAVADDVDAVLDALDHLGDVELLLARRERHVRHALELHAGPANRRSSSPATPSRR